MIEIAPVYFVDLLKGLNPDNRKESKAFIKFFPEWNPNR